jgi:hypothetical protein
MFRLMPRVLAWSMVWLTCAGAVCLLSPDRAAGFEVRVRAKSTLDASVTAAGTYVRVTGSLRDELDRGLTQRKIDIYFVDTKTGETVRPPDYDEIYTDRRGGFSTSRELEPGRWRVTARFSETEHVTASDVSRNVTVEYAPVDLRVQCPERVIGTVASVPLRFRVSAAGVGLSATAHIFVNGVAAGQKTLNQFGRGSINIAGMLTTGVNDVVVRIPASRHREAAEVESKLHVSPSVDVEAVFDEVVERLQRGVAVEGEISDDLGPLSGVRVAVAIRREGDSEDIRQREDVRPRQAAPADSVRAGRRARFERFVTTDADGSFRAFYAADDLEDGTWHAQTTVMPEIGSEISVPTEALVLDRTTSRWVLNALGLLALVGGLLLILQRLWQVIATHLARRRRERDHQKRSKDALRETEQLEPESLTDDQGPVEPNPKRTRLSGVVWDIWKMRPVADAELIVSTQDGQQVMSEHTSNSIPERPGGFILDHLEHGSYVLEVRARGFMAGKLAFQIPHRGPLSNMRLDLVAVPLKIRRLYQSLVERLEGEDLWGRLSPREIETTLLELTDRAGQGAESPAQRAFLDSLDRRLRQTDEAIDADELVAMMTAVVEETYFSGRSFDHSVWELARDIALELRARFEEASP